MKPRRLNSDVRKEQIVDAALAIARDFGFSCMIRDNIANKLGVSSPLIQHHFGTMKQLRRAVVRKAIQDKCLPVLAQLIALRDPLVADLDSTVREQAIRSLANVPT